MENFDEHLFSFFDDDQFIKWVTAGDDTSENYWKAWMKKNPGRVGELLKAKQIAEELAKAQKPRQDEKQSQKIWEKINARLDQTLQTVAISGSAPGKTVRTRFIAAACVGGILLLASSIYYFSGSGNRLGKPKGKITSQIVSNKLNHVNYSSESQVVYLVDGSKVTLQPGSSLSHAIFLQPEKREVYLDGDAFFEVAKDASRPFYVYAQDIVLRVLGTSFNVTTNKKNGNITVLVRTGKVSVFKTNNTRSPAYILTPNQSIRYTAQTQSIVKSAFDSELAKTEMKTPPVTNFDFEEAPLGTIFSVLQQAYGIRINYDEKIFSKCIITAPLHDETFEEKLKIICEAVGATYRIDDNEVFIQGSACR